MHIDRIPVYRVYQRAIDLELYHAFAELVVQTSQDDTARRTYRQTRAMQIWQVETDVSGYFEPYHLRYPGEVLERFEEKLGNDVRVLRALALALGNTCAIQSDNMFVGNQRGAFLQKLRRSAGEDVYLQGALYLLETDAAQRHALLEKLAERECTRTEEALFVLSLFDDRERGYEVMHTQLSHLFTQNLTLSLVYDFGVLEWFIRFYAEQWKGLSMLTEHQRDMMRQPFLGSYLFFWHQNERKALELLEQNRPLQRVCILLYRYGVRLFLSVERLKALRWMKMTDVGKFRRLLAVFEYDAEDLSAFFDLWLDNHAGQYDLNWFISQPHPLSKEQREEILCNQLSYLNALYAGRLHLDFNAVRQFQFSILIYAVEHRKKHFLELVNQNSEVFLSLGRYSLLFEPGFCEHCNINSLTLKNLKASDSVNRSDSFFTLLEEGQQYTFEEMYQLWHQKEVYVRLYTMLTPLSIDQRLLTLRQLIKRDLVSQYTGDAELEQLGKCLLERPFSEWYRGSFGHICGLTRRIAMGLLQHYTQLQAFIPDFTTESDAVFALNNMKALLEMTDWKQVRKDILTTDADWLDLKEKLAFSDDFVEQNRETVTEFLLQGGAAMVCALYGELDGQELAVEALRRIVQAELMGQFYKLKYFAGDLQREIRYPVSEMQESLWKKNLSLARGAFWAEEVDDFYHTLRLGELPHSTCLSYRTGSQRECLLAAFDSNKKIVLVKKDEAVVARACLRLTKGAFQKPPAVDFSFADLSQENMDIGKPVTSEKPVLFLESIYTFGLNDIEKEEVMKLAVSLTTQKAAELGVVAVLARRYLGCYERDEYVLAPFYVYISKSKNGWQYLDSLGGAAYTSAKEEYVEHPFLVMQTAMHQAEANSRNEVYYE